MYVLRTLWTALLTLALAGLSGTEPTSLESCSFHKSVAPGDFQNSSIPLANLEGEPSAYIHNCVNVITGQFCETSVDLVVHHPTDALVLERIYLGSSERPGMLGHGWTTNFSHSLTSRLLDSRGFHDYKLWLHDSGSDFNFNASPNKEPSTITDMCISPETLTRGVTNTASGYLSGQTNVKNYRLSSNKDRKTWQLKNGSGTVKSYSYFQKQGEFAHYHLQNEQRISGNSIYYVQPGSNNKGYINLVGHKLNFLGSIQTPPVWDSKDSATREFSTSDGRWTRYHYAVHNKHDTLLEKVEGSNTPLIKYEYQTHGRVENGNTIRLYYFLKGKSLPDGRCLNLEYYGRGLNQVLGDVIIVDQAPDARFERVKRILAPAGHDATLVPIYNFIYDLNMVKPQNAFLPNMKVVLDGSCTVIDALGYKTGYKFNSGLRLESIVHNPDSQAIVKESLFWGKPLSKDDTFLLARTLSTQGVNIFARTYEYDNAGNILKEFLFGNLSGHSQISPIVDNDGKIFPNGSESYTIIREYSNDGLNLLTKETDGFLTTRYIYQPGGNRLQVKLQGDGKQWQRRCFYTYDQESILIKEIKDDGRSQDPNDLSGVTERYITYYTPKKIHPVGLPEVIEEKCLDLATGRELLIQKTINTYTNLAKVSKQDHYDNQGQLVYSLHWEYDQFGNPIKEIDALGQVTVRLFDANSNCVFEQGPDSRYHKKFTYDFMNRLIKEEEVHSDGILSISHRYDLKGNCIATIDAFGNEILFKHDFAGRVVEIIYPPASNQDGKTEKSVVKKAYNAMGSVIKETDARGIETNKTYTIRGQLASIEYADGRMERKRYLLNGSLHEVIDSTGTLTRFTNDSFGRPLKIETFSATGELLTTTTSTYNGFHVLTEIDPLGLVTTYTYFPDGKIKDKRKGDSLVSYTYDSIGRLIKTIEAFGQKSNEVVVKVCQYDLLNRAIEEKIQDNQGTTLTCVSYEYDVIGNVTKTVSYGAHGKCIVTTDFDSHGVPHIITDAEGNKTVTVCRYDYFNALGQRVAYKESTDPMGNLTICIYDALGRNVSQIKKNSYGRVIQQQDMAYDANKNIIAITDSVIMENESNKKVVTSMQYDTCNRLTACYEALGTPEQKQTKFTYNQFGQKNGIIKNDGVLLTQTYDALGRLETLTSSDNTIGYRYIYDLKGNLIVTKDLITGSKTERKYDVNDRPIKESLLHGLVVDYLYDRIGRPLQVKLHDGSAIDYHYDANFLRSIDRKDNNGKTLYTHRYDSYDLAGHLLQSHLVGQTGTIEYTYDKSGQLQETTASQWNEKIEERDKVGNIRKKVVTTDNAPVQSSYSYDDLYQISSEAGFVSHSYAHDSFYNKRSVDGINYYYNSLHQLLDDGVNTYSYDFNGNLTEKHSETGITTYSYDALDRLIAVTTAETKVEYAYDATNRRLSKSHYEMGISGSWDLIDQERYLYQGQNEIGTADQQGKIIELRVLGIGKGAEIGAAVAIEIGSNTFVPIHDHTGSVTCLLDPTSGDVVERYCYSASGKELFDAALSPWRYASKRYDDETGFVYFGRRYYDPETSRWITPDPMGREGGANLYAYVLNNALNGCDLYGLEGFFDDVCSGVMSCLEYIGSAVNRCVASVGDFWRKECPIPILRDSISAIHHLCTRGTLDGYKMEHQGPHSSNGMQYGVAFNGVPPVGFSVGIRCEREDTAESVRLTSRGFGDSNVFFVANATHGTLTDLGETTCQKMNIHTNSVTQCIKMVYEMFSTVGEGGRILLVGHSQGGQIIDCLRYHLPKEMLKRIDVVTVGSAKMVSSKYFGTAVNYVSTRDMVPFIADPIGIISSFFSKETDVRFVQSDGIPFFDHAYANKTYQWVINYVGQEYLKNVQKN